MTQQQYSRRSSSCNCSVQQKSFLNEKKTKSPDITSRPLKFLNVSAVCVFYVVMICSFLKINSFSGCKIKTNIDINQINLDFLCKKSRKRYNFAHQKDHLCAVVAKIQLCILCLLNIFCHINKKVKILMLYFVFSVFYTIFALSFHIII